VPAVGVLGAAVVAGAVAASQPSEPSERPGGRAGATATSSPSSTLPVVLSSCFVPSTPTNVSFDTTEAMQLTTLAAGVRDVERGRGRVEAAVALAAPDVTSEQVTDATDSLLGLRPGDRLTCAHPRAEVEPERMGPNGLTPRAQRLRRTWTRVFGPIASGGFARGGVSSGHVDGSSHYDGRAIDVFFRPLGDEEQKRRGLVFAQWLVAHAERYHVLSVIHADRIWTSWAAFLGWRDYVHPSGDTRNPVLRHLEHVHVAVESGEAYRGG
jgi:hypothetical protein